RVELFGEDLQKRGVDTGAEVDFAGIASAHALGVDRQERADLGERQRFCRAGSLRERLGERPADREGDDEGAAALEHVASRCMDVHGPLPHATVAARFTARTMQACVPQRQGLLARAFLMSASLGFFVFARKAADSMIMPLMQ